MARRCICDVDLTLHNAVVLDCNHILCQECSCIWATDQSCPRCHVENALDLLPVTDVDGMKEGIVNRLTQFFCAKAKRLSTEKHDALLSDRSFSPFLNELPVVRGNTVRNDAPIDRSTVMSADRTSGNGEHKRKRNKENDSTISNGDDEQLLDTRKRLKATNYQIKCSQDSLMVRKLQKEIEELKLQVEKANSDLEMQEKTYTERLTILKRRYGDVEQKARKNCGDMARKVKTQSDKIKELNVDASDLSDKLLAAQKVIQRLKSQAEYNRLALHKAERRTTEYEDWGHKTKAYYQDIIKQMEIHQPRPDYLAPPSPYARGYLRELPSLRVVSPNNELLDNEESLFSHETDEVARMPSDTHGSFLVPPHSLGSQRAS